MTYRELAQAAKQFYPAVRLDGAATHRTRRAVIKVLEWLTLAALLGGIGAWWFTGTSVGLGLFLVLVVAWTIADLGEAFYNSYYYGDARWLSFEVATVLYHNDEKDLTKSFFGSTWGKLVLFRLGLSLDDVERFLSERKMRISAGVLNFTGSRVALGEYARALYATDNSLAQFLLTRKVGEGEWVGAARWIDREAELRRRHDQWWSRAALSRVPGLGKDWAYGETWELEKFAREVVGSGREGALSAYSRDEVEALQGVLARVREANALLVGDDSAFLLECIHELAGEIEAGRVPPALEHKRVFALDGELLISSTGDKPHFELELARVLAQTVKAGNIILVIPNFPAWLESAKALGADPLAVLAPYFASPDLQLIGLCLADQFHAVIESDQGLMEHFERVLVTDKGSDSLLGVLEEEALALEAREGVYFTYQALAAALSAAERYWSAAAPADKALDLLLEAVSAARAAKRPLIGESELLALVSSKIHVPLGEVKPAEKEALLHLEAKLHERVIGQNEAITAVAETLRRARTGINNPKRPMGSFLFLGPTGVGKTETVKTLAANFFNDEAAVIRLDMSEYQAADAMPKLLGEFGRKQPGVLTSALRERPYGVLLLDEFEKSAPEVRDLFLQILDEGAFSDMAGKRVDARSLLIIATSNAGSDLIWQYGREGGSLAPHKAEIVDHVIKAGIFKPELINRFDGVILFQPLGPRELTAIAKLELARLASRLKARGFTLVVTEPLVQYLVSQGTDPQFGARPLNRAIQDTVERLAADKILRDSLEPGASIIITPEELESRALAG